VQSECFNNFCRFITTKGVVMPKISIVHYRDYLKLLNSNQMSMQSFKIFPGVDIVN
jgi:hypothetical protein